MSQENVEIVQGLMLAPDVDLAPLFRNDETWTLLHEGVSSLIHPDFECAATVLGVETTYAGGVDGFRDFWLEWLAPWESYRSETERITDLKDRVLQFAIEYGRLPGATAETRGDNASIWTFSDGRIIHFHGFSQRAEALKAVGLEE